MSCQPIVPSPIPPWHRPVLSPQTTTLFNDGAIDLNYDTIYLSSNAQKMVNNLPVPYNVTLPNGNYNRQTIRIYGDIDYVKLNTSAPFLVTGTIAGMTSLKFDNLGFSAVLEWVPGVSNDGAWVLVAGNATPIP